MTLHEASTASGFAVRTLYRKIKEGAFVAFLPKGRRGGWEINESSFRSWVRANRIASANK